jgi:hypothetical protein
MEILGCANQEVVEFAVMKNGHHYHYDEAMNNWARTGLMVVFVDDEAAKASQHDQYAWKGTLDGLHAFHFMDDWVQFMDGKEQELADDDPRVRALRAPIRGRAGGPPDWLLGLLGGGA